MAQFVYWLGVFVGALLLLLLVASLRRAGLRIWPTPGDKTWQSYVFWPLFRGLNVLCFAVAALDPSAKGWLHRAPALGLPGPLRAIAAILLAVCVAVFVYAFRILGRDNSYGASDGLVTGGIYQWSRNPQNAMLVVVYACLAFAADSGPVYVLCGAMIAVYVLMVLLEEPWLEGIYGEAYRAYCREVPRFFNWRRALSGSDH